MADEREQRFTRAERAALYAVFAHGDARPWERDIVAKCGGLAAWRALTERAYLDARSATKKAQAAQLLAQDRYARAKARAEKAPSSSEEA